MTVIHGLVYLHHHFWVLLGLLVSLAGLAAILQAMALILAPTSRFRRVRRFWVDHRGYPDAEWLRGEDR